jgi:ABC-type bacteriocin/lantibiotic exporter with double-glycine peptidase domain
MRRLIGGRTVVLVTHRPGPLALADQIVRLEPSAGASAEGASDPALATAAVNPW